MNKDLKILNDAFQAFLISNKEGGNPNTLYEPANYIMNSGGKHIRPLLLLAATKIWTTDWKKALPAALGVEMFHNFTLIHDDIMDEADMRRGMKSVHHLYGTNQAILSGDVMMMRSMEIILSSMDSDLYKKVSSNFLRVGIKICEGQQLDVDFEGIVHPSLEDYLEMIKGKTAVLPAEALRTGALIGGATDEEANCLYEFGLNLGLAFQIQDDILDVYGDAEKFGKIMGGDIRQNKKSALYVVAMEECCTDDVLMIKNIFQEKNQSDEKVNRVKNIWSRAHIKSKVEDVKQTFYEESKSWLMKLHDQNLDFSLLEHLSKILLNRSR